MKPSGAWTLLRGRYPGSGPLANIEEQLGLRLGTIYGCGSFGCVFATDQPGWVVKLTRDEKEAAAANAILRGEVRSPALPRIRNVLAFSDTKSLSNGGRYGNKAYFLIVREDLRDVPPELAAQWSQCFSWIQGFSEARPPRPYPRCEAQLDPRLRTFAQRLARLVHGEDSRSGVVARLSDVRGPNLGLRANGQVVIRDIGTSFVGEAAPFLAGLDLGNRKLWWGAVAGLAVALGLVVVRMQKSGSPAGVRRIVALGDSWTAHGGYLKELLRLLQAQPGRAETTGKSIGFVGKPIAVIQGHLPEALAEKPTDLIILAGINDLPGGNAEAMKQGLTKLWTAAKASGARLTVVKLPPNLGYPTLKGRLAAWEEVNRFIDGSKLPDAVVDASRLGSPQRTLLPAFDSGDHLHANAAGQKLLGQAIFEQAFA